MLISKEAFSHILFLALEAKVARRIQRVEESSLF